MSKLPGLRRTQARLATRSVVVAAVAALFGVCGCTSMASPVPSPRPAAASTLAGLAPAHVALIVMENHEYGAVIGSRSAPFINGLARRYALATAMHAIRHPSLPNYLALSSGSTFGITSDCTSCEVQQTSIVDQLEQAHISWKAYIQGMPGPCVLGEGTDINHDPFAYYTAIRDNPSWCANIVPLTQLATDERAGNLPRFVWITPNNCNDMHDCSVATGDRFLSSLVPPLLRALGHHGVLFLTWDEGSTNASCCGQAAGGHIATIVAGPGARRGARLGTPTDHYSVLQTIEDALRLPRLRGAASPRTKSLSQLLAGY